MFYTLVHYFDVWGNAKDGFQINDQCVECDNFFIDESATDKEICTRLMNAGYLRTDDMRRLKVEHDFAVFMGGSAMEVQLKNGHPIFALIPNK